MQGREYLAMWLHTCTPTKLWSAATAIDPSKAPPVYRKPAWAHSQPSC